MYARKGPIPAHAGQPAYTLKKRRFIWGPSPLTRGNRGARLQLILLAGPIPAHAGQPRWPTPWAWPARAHPRSRGATTELGELIAGTRGPSPLTRGNPLDLGRAAPLDGPIPAHAGQPTSSRHPGWLQGAHPRSRGATTCACSSATYRAGPSPLTRGNHDSRCASRTPLGPIPAHAGQPTSTSCGPMKARAHPRSRGATTAAIGRVTSATGPSPLTRGNRQSLPAPAHRWGPIPAHAGQPWTASTRRLKTRAHPRSRGATSMQGAPMSAALGPSPLTRGNLGKQRTGTVAQGPIPAHAGQPLEGGLHHQLRTAHPRSRGATPPGRLLVRSSRGPSPLTRGNRGNLRIRPAQAGPIPAHAGQPLQHPGIPRPQRAHPRSRGATPEGTSLPQDRPGPSPLTRGNRRRRQRRRRRAGPIPAHAGQPHSYSMSASLTWAHPRSRGATSGTSPQVRL